MFSHDALWYQILQGPIAIIGGLGFGVMWGWLAKYVPEKGDVSTFSLAVLLRCCKTALRIMIANCDIPSHVSAAVRVETYEREFLQGRKMTYPSGVSDVGEVSHGPGRRGVSARCRRCVLNVLLKLQPYSRRSQVMSAAVRKNVPSRGSGLKFRTYVT